MTDQREVEKAAAAVADAHAVAVLTGAGVSAESGVPTFRGADGLWRNRRAQDLATPEAFHRDPALVWGFYNERRNALLKVAPNPAHQGLAELERIIATFTLVTQNVDRLHQRAGSSRVLEVHGNIWDVSCTQCCERFDRTSVVLPELPTCPICGGLLRPCVVWFGESLPQDVWSEAEQAVRQAACLLVIGTSAQVFPAAGLIALAHRRGASVIEINLEPTSGGATIGLYDRAGVVIPQLVEQVRLLR